MISVIELAVDIPEDDSGDPELPLISPARFGHHSALDLGKP